MANPYFLDAHVMYIIPRIQDLGALFPQNQSHSCRLLYTTIHPFISSFSSYNYSLQQAGT